MKINHSMYFILIILFSFSFITINQKTKKFYFAFAIILFVMSVLTRSLSVSRDAYYKMRLHSISCISISVLLYWGGGESWRVVIILDLERKFFPREMVRYSNIVHITQHKLKQRDIFSRCRSIASHKSVLQVTITQKSSIFTEYRTKRPVNKVMLSSGNIAYYFTFHSRDFSYPSLRKGFKNIPLSS